MRIVDLLKKEGVSLGVKASSKEEIIDIMVDLQDKSGNITSKETYKQGILKRESEGSTAVGMGIAIPHTKNPAVKQPGLVAVTVPDGVDYKSPSGDMSTLLFMIAAPENGGDVHLEVLSRLMTMLMDETFSNSLRGAKSPAEFLDIIDKKEAEKYPDEQPQAAATSAPASDKFIIGVTACPTGIAHTYMAAEALVQQAEKMGVKIKIETRGSGGAKNVLTAAEIAEADGVIVACDTKVPMDRFDGKHLIQCPVADGIHKAEELINKAPTAPVFKASGASTDSASSEEKLSIGGAFYKHLMSGVSHMLPFVIGGGILVAIAFLIDTICGYGATGGGNFGTMTPLSALFKYVGGLAMGLMVPVLAGYIAYSIADRPGLAVGFVGGIIASSGNALAANYAEIWKSNDAFNTFIKNFAFQGTGNTVSGFLGGILAGFLAGGIILVLKKACSGLPQALEGIKPTLIYPLVGMFIMMILMCFIFNPIVGLINTALSNGLTAIYNAHLILLLGLILGAMMAIDMGGPINKAAYVFGTGMLASAALDPSLCDAAYTSMAAIMVGGMVPPVGIALACIFFKKKFTKAERGATVSNIVMGCSFITEGAIPFAASDPLHVIPCTMVGSGVAGLLSAAFGCTLMAPHGGIFVFATVGNPFMYIVAWLVGSIITAVMLGIIKRPVKE